MAKQATTAETSDFKHLKKGKSVTVKGRIFKGGTKTGKIKADLADYIGLDAKLFETATKAEK